MPVERMENGTWPHPARLPLGSGWRGHCTAPGHEGELPARDILEAFCNLGYVDCCTWAPRERTWDAVRFAVAAPPKGGARHPNGDPNGSARLVRLHYICERDHRPVEHGDLEFDLSRMQCLQPHHDARIQKMAQCFLESYLNKKI